MKTIYFSSLVAISLFTLHAHSQALAPGLWKTETSFTVNGIAMPKSKDEECISPDKASDVKASITKDLEKKGCVLKTWNVKNSVLDASLECKSDSLDAKGKLKGTFSNKSYELKGEADGKFQKMIPSSAKIRLKGTWVQDCAPKGS